MLIIPLKSIALVAWLGLISFVDPSLDGATTLHEQALQANFFFFFFFEGTIQLLTLVESEVKE